LGKEVAANIVMTKAVFVIEIVALICLKDNTYKSGEAKAGIVLPKISLD